MEYLDDVISKNVAITSIVGDGSKPSFLLWDKVYLKIKEEGEEKWLLRAIKVAMRYFRKDLKRSNVVRYTYNSPLRDVLILPGRLNFGSVLLRLAVASSHKDIRQSTNNMIQDAAKWEPELTTTFAGEAIIASLTSPISKSVGQSTDARIKHARLASFLLSAVAYRKDLEMELKETLVTNLVIAAHHERVCEFLPLVCDTNMV